MRTSILPIVLLIASAANISAAPHPLPASDSIPGRPMIVVASAIPEPREGAEGDYPRTFNARLQIKNTGWVIAYRVMLTLPENPYVSVENGSATLGLGYIYAGNTKEVVIPMYLDTADENGRVQPVFHLQYWDEDGRLYTNDEPVRLEFGQQGWNQPTLLIASANTTPENPAPGEECTLTITLSNVTNGDARQVLVRLGGTEGPKPFAMVGTSNVGFIGSVPGAQKAEVTFPLLVEGGATPGVYPIPVTLSYQNLLGILQEDSVVIYLKVRTLPALQANLLRDLPDEIFVGDEFDLSVEVINTGLQSLNIGTVELVSGSVGLSNASVYSGPLDPSTSTSLSANAVAKTAGPARVDIVVHYIDEYNQAHTWTQTIEFEIADHPQTIEEDTPATDEGVQTWDQIWNAILGFLGFGG